MEPARILWPMVALVALTFAVLLLIPLARFRAAARGQVSARDFRYGESSNVPGEVSLPNRNLMNLLELPVLFYVVCLAFFVTGKVATRPRWCSPGSTSRCARRIASFISATTACFTA